MTVLAGIGIVVYLIFWYLRHRDRNRLKKSVDCLSETVTVAKALRLAEETERTIQLARETAEQEREREEARQERLRAEARHRELQEDARADARAQAAARKWEAKHRRPKGREVDETVRGRILQDRARKAWALRRQNDPSQRLLEPVRQAGKRGRRERWEKEAG